MMDAVNISNFVFRCCIFFSSEIPGLTEGTFDRLFSPGPAEICLCPRD